MGIWNAIWDHAEARAIRMCQENMIAGAIASPSWTAIRNIRSGSIFPLCLLGVFLTPHMLTLREVQVAEIAYRLRAWTRIGLGCGNIPRAHPERFDCLSRTALCACHKLGFVIPVQAGPAQSSHTPRS